MELFCQLRRNFCHHPYLRLLVFAREVEGIGNCPFWTDSGGLFQLPSSSSSYLPANTLSLSSGDSLFLWESDNPKSVSRRHRRERSAQKTEGRSATTLNLFMPPPNRFCLNVPRLVKLRERKSRRAAMPGAGARSYRLILGLIRSRGLASSAFTFIPDCIAACLPSSLDRF